MEVIICINIQSLNRRGAFFGGGGVIASEGVGANSPHKMPGSLILPTPDSEEPAFLEESTNGRIIKISIQEPKKRTLLQSAL